MPEVTVEESTVTLEFTANGLQFPDFGVDERVRLLFHGARQYRLGPTNDEGWLRGQCRFSLLAPDWGEFYEVLGDVKLNQMPDDWHFISDSLSDKSSHYLFYLRDETFECTATSWEFVRDPSLSPDG